MLAVVLVVVGGVVVTAVVMVVVVVVTAGVKSSREGEFPKMCPHKINDAVLMW